MKTEWNYTKLATPYLTRPDYSTIALEKMFLQMNLESDARICDVGAGVAHLTLPLLERGHFVDAVEPNDEMRELGKTRTQDYKTASWFEGTGENTGMEDNFYDLVTFGSSFNVTDRIRALEETNRILKSNGWFACMWNHRDLEDLHQKAIENIIKTFIPDYNYGTRREDQTAVIKNSGLFPTVHYAEGRVVHSVEKKEWVNAWRSHATLERQAQGNFEMIVDRIEEYINAINEEEVLVIPYTTRIWFAQKS
jgi:ubiquinone/menaquinone biosynthesis C-methylase UbiE